MDNAKGSDWLFESTVVSLRDNNRNLLWVCGAFLTASFITVAFNLGAVDSFAFQALSIEASVSSSLPIRAMLCVVCFVTFSAVVYVVVEQLRLQLGLEFLAARKHSHAQKLDSFQAWLSEKHPLVSRAKSIATGSFVVFCAAILLIDIATLFYSFSN